MTVLTVARQGEAVLGLVATAVADSEFGSEWLYQLNKAMMDIMLDRQGVGIAAPQVHISKRIIIVASRPNLRYPEAPYMEAVTMLNPEIVHVSEAQVLGEAASGAVREGKALRLRDALHEPRDGGHRPAHGRWRRRWVRLRRHDGTPADPCRDVT